MTGPVQNINLMDFSIQPLSRFATGKTTIRRPREIACFSYDGGHKFLPMSEASLRYYCPPLFGAPGEYDDNFPIRLGDGFDSFRLHDEVNDEHIDSLLDTIQALEKKQGHRVDADIVTWRGMMTKILTAPYDTFNEGFEMNATFHQGTIYIEENHAYKLRRNQSSASQRSRPGQPSQAEMQYWGYKFEALSTLKRRTVEASREEIENRSEEIVTTAAQYCSIVQTGIGDTSLIIGGEVDAVLGEKPDDPNDSIPWVELKTTKIIENQRDAKKYEDKLLRFWAQSFLLGVPHVVVGFRSADGRLLKIEQIDTHRIPGIAKRMAAMENRATWDGNLCINFASHLLSFLKQHISEPGAVWRIVLKPSTGRVTLSVDKTIDPASIVKPSFVAHREKL